MAKFYVNVKDTINIETFDILNQSTVNGFPFFNYTGIKYIEDLGENILYLKLPKNPSGYNQLVILYNIGKDTYDLQFYDGDNMITEGDKELDVYNNELSDIIVKKLGID